jgi:hypothetical protein
MYAAPDVTSGSHTYSTFVLQNESGFDGVLVFGRSDPDADPDRMIVFDRATGAIAAFTQDGSGIDGMADEISNASNSLMAGDPSGGDTQTADFVTDNNVCFIQFATFALAGIGAALAAPFVIEEGAAALAWASASYTAIGERGLATFATETAKAAWADPKVRGLIAFKAAEEGLKAWLLFTESGHKFMAPVIDELSKVVHAKCFPTDEVVGVGTDIPP